MKSKNIYKTTWIIAEIKDDMESKTSNLIIQPEDSFEKI